MKQGYSLNQVVLLAVVALAVLSMLFVFYNPMASVNISFGLDGIHLQINGNQIAQSN